MDSLEFDALQLRIIQFLKQQGPTTAEGLAARLQVPHGNVRFALEQLHERRQPLVIRLPFGFWDTADAISVAAEASAVIARRSRPTFAKGCD